jgi:hypothetical protein
MKQATVALVSLAIGAWLAYAHVASQTYHPVVQVRSAEGLTYTAVQASSSDRQACGAANERFLRPLKERCRQCEVQFARCARKLEGLGAALQEDAPLPHYRVFAPGIRLAIVGSPTSAKRTCEFVAADMVRRGLPSAACVYPA